MEDFFEMEGNVWQCKDGRKHDSLNHHFWGDVSAWFISYVAGIKINPDFTTPNTVEISPVFPAQLSFAQGKYLHENGEILCRWVRTDEREITLYLTLPKGLDVRLRLPNGYACSENTLVAGAQKIVITRA
jgi:hypothetical protein